jgi:hypothetical protein
MANASGSRTHANVQVFDVKVLAFPAATPHTVQGLMQLSNIDRASAERLIADVPLLLNQQVTGAEAEACAQSLRKLGARVVVEPAALPTAHTARWSQPASFEEDLLPQPRAMPVANDTDLEYDVLSQQDTGYVAHQSISTSLRDGVDMDLGNDEPDLLANDMMLRRSRQESIDLQGGPASPDLELAAPEAAREKKPNREAEGARTRPQKQEASGPHPAARPRPAEGASPHGRAATVQHTQEVQKVTRTLPLLQVLCAFAVAAIGYWADSSVIFGNASLWSVIAHGAALYQLILGVRGLAS